MKEKTYLRLIQFSLIASLAFIFFVFKGLLFPFITSKQFAFNILIEVLLFIWLIFILKFPAYRPKSNLISYSLLAYFIAILLSIFVSVDPSLSFWGDAERMLGFFHVAHFFFFYLFITSVFRSWSDFKILFSASVLIATIVSLIGIFGANVSSVIGNTAYVSGYLIFNIFFALILFFRENNKKIKFFYLLPVVIMFWEFLLCKTSGAIIAMFFSTLLFFFLLAFFHQQKRIRKGAIFMLVISIIAVILIFSQQNKAWFQDSFFKNLTSQKITFQTRLISWKSAAKDFHNHPFLGTGFGTYAITFDRHFDSKFLNYAPNEAYFDRAHNNLIDIASTTGLIGLSTYLLIFISVFYYLYQELKANGFKVGTAELSSSRNLEAFLLLSLFSAYFIQNLAIFDSYATYIALMISLAFVYFLSSERSREKDLMKEKKAYLKNKGWEIILLIVFLFSSYIVVFNFNIKPQKSLKALISGYINILNKDLVSGYAFFKDSFINHPLERDARVVVINIFNSSFRDLSFLAKDDLDEVVEFVISLARKNVEFNPNDSLMQMQLSKVLETSARLYGQSDKEKRDYLLNEALLAIDKSIAASPGRATIYFAKAKLLLISNRADEGIETINYAINLNPEYYEGHCLLAQFKFELKDEDGLKEAIDSCVDLGGVKAIDSVDFLTKSIGYLINASGVSYKLESIDEASLERALPMALRLTELYPKEPDVFLNTAKIYLLIGDNDKSAEYLLQAYRLDSANTIKSEWDEFLDWLGLGED